VGARKKGKKVGKEGKSDLPGRLRYWKNPQDVRITPTGGGREGGGGSQERCSLQRSRWREREVRIFPELKSLDERGMIQQREFSREDPYWGLGRRVARNPQERVGERP